MSVAEFGPQDLLWPHLIRSRRALGRRRSRISLRLKMRAEAGSRVRSKTAQWSPAIAWLSRLWQACLVEPIHQRWPFRVPRPQFAYPRGERRDVVLPLRDHVQVAQELCGLEQVGMTEADVLALAMSGPAEDFSIPDEVYVGGRRVPRQKLPRLKKPAAPTVHTVKASLHGAKPPVWRRLELPSELTLDMVHEVMQIAFSWHGYHLHQFETACGAFGRPDGDWGFEEVGDESAVALAQVAAEEKAKIAYVYDFGDDWRHDIVVEKITPALPGVAYPRCTGGRGWAPEEDSGGIWAHNEAVAAVSAVSRSRPNDPAAA